MDNSLCQKQIYHLYPLGALCNGEGLSSLAEWADYWKQLSITTLLLGPLFQSNNHGYDISDYYKVDARLGTNEDLKGLVSSLKKQGIEVYLDAVFHHVGRRFFAFNDVLVHHERSRYFHWFFINQGGNSPFNDGFDYQNWEGHYDLIKFNLHNPEVKQFLFEVVKYWVKELGITGLRLDVAHQLEPSFIFELRSFCESLGEDIVLIGEAIHGDYRRLVSDTALHSVTNYEVYKGLYSSHNDRNYFEIAYSLERQYSSKHGIYRNMCLYNFVDNHDTNRINSAIREHKHTYPLHILMYTIPGYPSLYYGSEFGMDGKKEHGSDWNLRPSLDIHYCKKHGTKQEIFKHICKLADIRKHHPALAYGEYRQLFVNSEQFGFVRFDNGKQYIVLVNMSNAEVEVDINNNWPKGKCWDLLNNERVEVVNKIKIFPNWGRIIEVV